MRHRIHRQPGESVTESTHAPLTFPVTISSFRRVPSGRVQANVTYGIEDVFHHSASESREINVAGRPIGRAAPQRKERCTLQDEPVTMRGVAQAEKEPLGGVALQPELHVLAAFAETVTDASPNRFSSIVRPVAHADNASRYGPMTVRIRQASAVRQMASTLALRERTASRSASMATSRPTLFR